MPTEIPAKLRATMAALGCHSRKDLAARFRARNPRTACEIDSLHKWMQGRATPRVAAFYDEWAQLLGLARGGNWVAVCGLDSFIVELTVSTGIEAERLLRDAPSRSSRSSAAQPTHGLLGGQSSLHGVYLCYSRAFSLLYADH